MPTNTTPALVVDPCRADSFTVAGVGCMLMCMVNFGLLIFVGLGAAKVGSRGYRSQEHVMFALACPQLAGLGNEPAPRCASQRIMFLPPGMQSPLCT